MILLFLSGLFFFTPLHVSHAVAPEELFLEEDPDEQIAVPKDGMLQRRGYEELFSFNEQEVEGLKEVLFPVKKNIADLEIQSSKLALQQKRIQDVRKILAQKS